MYGEVNPDNAYLDNSIAGRLHVLDRLFAERASFSGGSAKLARAIHFEHRGRS